MPGATQQPYGGPVHGQPPHGQFPIAQHGYPAGGPMTGWAPAARPVRPIGALLMIFGAVVAVLATFLTWNHDHDLVDAPDGGLTPVPTDVWNGWDQIEVNIRQGRVYGTLMLVAFIIAILAAVMVIAAAIIALTARSVGIGAGVLALAGALIGLVGTLGVMLGYLALGATDETTFVMWLYGFSFVPVLIGAIGVVTRKY